MPPVEAALIPVTTPRQPVLNTRTCTGQHLLLAAWQRRVCRPRPGSRDAPVGLLR